MRECLREPPVSFRVAGRELAFPNWLNINKKTQGSLEIRAKIKKHGCDQTTRDHGGSTRDHGGS